MATTLRHQISTQTRPWVQVHFEWTPQGSKACFHGRRTPEHSRHLVPPLPPAAGTATRLLPLCSGCGYGDERPWADEKEICLIFTKNVFRSRKKKCFKLQRTSSLKMIMEKTKPFTDQFLFSRHCPLTEINIFSKNIWFNVFWCKIKLPLYLVLIF